MGHPAVPGHPPRCALQRLTVWVRAPRGRTIRAVTRNDPGRAGSRARPRRGRRYPLAQQLVDELRRRVQAGALGPGERLPPVRSLASVPQWRPRRSPARTSASSTRAICGVRSAAALSSPRRRWAPKKTRWRLSKLVARCRRSRRRHPRRGRRRSATCCVWPTSPGWSRSSPQRRRPRAHRRPAQDGRAAWTDEHPPGGLAGRQERRHPRPGPLVADLPGAGDLVRDAPSLTRRACTSTTSRRRRWTATPCSGCCCASRSSTAPSPRRASVNGSVLHARSTARGGTCLRGKGADGVILTEAAFVPTEAYQQVIAPTVLDRRGQLELDTTPNGPTTHDPSSSWARSNMTGGATWAVASLCCHVVRSMGAGCTSRQPTRSRPYRRWRLFHRRGTRGQSGGAGLLRLAAVKALEE